MTSPPASCDHHAVWRDRRFLTSQPEPLPTGSEADGDQEAMGLAGDINQAGLGSEARPSEAYVDEGR